MAQTGHGHSQRRTRLLRQARRPQDFREHVARDGGTAGRDQRAKEALGQDAADPDLAVRTLEPNPARAATDCGMRRAS